MDSQTNLKPSSVFCQSEGVSVNDLFRPWAWKWGLLANYFLVVLVRLGLWPLFIFCRELPQRPRTTRKGTLAVVLLEIDHKGKREQIGHKACRKIGHKCAEND